ncbi:LysE family translocator [Limisalsivibrio acetivorans]|uniref:LysE family translocator n=1 Tax=Limisalsivibrio acetivorans TaxID=1304888 RepID=UPI0003B7068C|nr:LysE family translocator [Limisalsivibrio acetivorans]
MDSFGFVTLAGAMAVLAASPGPGVLATVSKSLSTGLRSSVPLILGIILGDLIFLIFSLYGLAAVAEAYSEFFIFIKYAGGGYLIYLGFNLFFRKPEGENEMPNKRYSGFFSGLAVTLSNPKVVLFYCGFLPAFIDIRNIHISDVFVIALVVSLVLGSVLLIYSIVADRASVFVKDKGAGRIINRISGAVMGFAGGVLILKD